jgi:biotin transport system substrate-specific component
MNGNILSMLWPRAQAQLISKVVLVVLGVLLLAASAKVKVPFWPVQMTLQTAVVLLIGGPMARGW